MEFASLIIGCFLLVAYVLDYALYKKTRKELNEYAKELSRWRNQVCILNSKMSYTQDALRSLVGYNYGSKGKDFEGNIIDVMSYTIDALLKELGYTFQPPTEEPAKLVKIEKKDVSQPVNALNLGGWSITQDGDRLKITNDGRFITYLNPNAEEPKPREETK
ncbi:MAG: hypothetical protein HF309_19310 [Ignavibacteria bacterium]|jgi:hypothetical protein|nr:hypothetical protein [Ignavibacteria bacterium]MCU7518529.1 hypothetical protein [Ignavibacteria bacterium]